VADQVNEIVNDLVAKKAEFQIQGHKITVDPNQFSVSMEIKIREVRAEEARLLKEARESEDFALLEQNLFTIRKAYADLGSELIPLLDTDWTPEAVQNLLSVEAIYAVLDRFLQVDWRPVQLMDRPSENPIMTLMTPATPLKRQPTRKKLSGGRR